MKGLTNTHHLLWNFLLVYYCVSKRQRVKEEREVRVVKISLTTTWARCFHCECFLLPLMFLQSVCFNDTPLFSSLFFLSLWSSHPSNESTSIKQRKGVNFIILLFLWHIQFKEREKKPYKESQNCRSNWCEKKNKSNFIKYIK